MGINLVSSWFQYCRETRRVYGQWCHFLLSLYCPKLDFKLNIDYKVKVTQKEICVCTLNI